LDEKISCHTCGQCNRQGKPSVMRGSLHCDVHQMGNINVARKSIFDKLKLNKWW